ncbi:unnamed protein product [Closterium sp. NIES-64]|nr:unnamed protein product [Closterium sp. NIES-64]CAI5974389.1 unnamed protein product [Closterium sp. NIES-65]
MVLLNCLLGCAAQSPWSCDISQGKWVADSALPLYTGSSCPYIRTSQNCLKQGRPDMSFQKFRWQPKGCSVKRVSPRSLAELLRGKLVVVFGDSLSKNFAASLQCMLYAADSAAAKAYRLAQNKTAEWGVEFPTYKIRFVSVFSNWLNNASSLPDKNGIEQHRIDLDGLDQRIKDVLPIADIVIFQATAWWLPPINRWYVGGAEVTMKATAAYERGLTTLRDYVADSSRRSSGKFKGRAVVMGVSPSHYNLPVRGVKKGKCNVTSMLTSAQTATVRDGDGATSELRAIQQRVLGGSAVAYVDVKPMSDWRPDAHIQNWSVKGGAPDTKKNDCLHWCEGGVTDAWVEMLFNKLQ